MQETQQNSLLPLKNYAHLGDAVYEVFIREIVINQTAHSKKLHQLTTKFVRAAFQADLLEKLQDIYTEEEQELIKRGKNLSLTVAKRSNQQVHRLATAFEVLIGYNYLHDKDRLNEIYEKLRKLILF